MKTVTLDIEKISDELYDLILKELREQNPDFNTFENWQVTADAQK